MNPTPASARVGAETAQDDLSTQAFLVKGDPDRPRPMTGTLYRHAGVRARVDSPSIADLVAEGWTVEFVNRWGGALLRRELNA